MLMHKQRSNERLVHLDILRGLAVALMILVVSPGSWEFTYGELQHTDWNGWSLADLVFPDFLFGVGMAIGLVFVRSTETAEKRALYRRKIAKRAAALVVLGLALNYLGVIAGWLGAPPVGPTDEITWRLPGVLQRIGLCYLFAVTLVLLTAENGDDGRPRPSVSRIVAVIAFILVGHWALLSFVPVPGFGAGDLGKAGNLPAYVDRAIFTPPHMWPLGSETWRGPVVYDPEGLLSTLPATANVLFGVLAITLWLREHTHRQAKFFMLGSALLAIGWALDPLLPINKKLWTSSFVLLTCGFSFLALVTVSQLMRFGAESLLAPLRWLGGNAILAFSVSIFLSAISGIPLHWAGKQTNLQSLGYEGSS